MNQRVAARLYLVGSAAFLAATVYGLVQAGVSVWWSMVLTYLLFSVVQGTLAYRAQVRRNGMRPGSASYLKYLFFGRRGNRDVGVPRLLRVSMGLAIIGGGLLFVFAVAVSLLPPYASHVPSTAAAAAMLFFVALLGVAFLYVGIRLVMVEDGARLFERPHRGTP